MVANEGVMDLVRCHSLFHSYPPAPALAPAPTAACDNTGPLTPPPCPSTSHAPPQVLNFLCSAEDVGLDLKTVVVFVGSPQDLQLVENMGAQGLYSTALGSMPAQVLCHS